MIRPSLPVLRGVLFGLLLGVASSGSAGATVWRVPTEILVFQNAVNENAADGDTIRVAGNGGSTYSFTNLTIDKDIRIEGGWRIDFAVRDPSLYKTVFRDTTAAQNRPMFRIEGPRSFTLDGVEVIGGRFGVLAPDGADIVVRDVRFAEQRNRTAGLDPEQNIGCAIRQLGGTLLVERTRIESILSIYPGGGFGLVDLTSASIVDCDFENITSFSTGNGGGIFARDVGMLTIDGVTMRSVSTLGKGGFVFAQRTPVLISSGDFRSGLASDEGGIFLDNCPSATLDSCTFEGNRSTNGGGGVVASDVPDLRMTDCIFRDNLMNVTQASPRGGVVRLLYSTFQLDGCTFESNLGVKVAERGGAVYALDSQGTVNGCTFRDERAVAGGGAWAQIGGLTTMTDCRFEQCRSQVYGGAVQIELAGLIVLDHCLLVDNSAKFGGSVAASFTGDVDLRHCTLVGGEARSAGAAVYVDTGATVRLFDSIACCATRAELLYCGSGTVVLDHTNLWNDDSINTRGEYGGACVNATGVNGNIVENPQICAADSNYTIDVGSPSAGAASDGSDMGWRPAGCPGPKPLSVESISWGRIKAAYRTP